jgi:AraC-like DNA-binding protein
MEKAEMLLRESAKSVTEIAYECGIPDSNYFSRMFKKYRGASPSDMRRASR